jgi:hypothetical protein
MKLKQMLSRDFISMFSKSMQKITPLTKSRDNIWKIRNRREIKGENLQAKIFSISK